MNAKHLIGFAGLIGLVATVALAQPPGDAPPYGPHGILQELDANGDGQISREEFDSVDLFDRLDTNKDGVLNPEDHRGLRHRPVHLVRLADADRDGTVTAAEWSGFLAAADPDNNGLVEKEAVQALLQERFGKGRGRSGGPEGRRGPAWDQDGAPALSVEALNAAFVELDKNADGALQSDELPQRRMGPHGRFHGRGQDGRR
jgi:hypothetical protein